MPFTDGTKAQDESATMVRRARLVRMPDDTWVEQGRSLERVFVEKIGTNQAALCFVQWSMGVKRVLHFRGARRENIEQVPVAPPEVLEHLAQ